MSPKNAAAVALGRKGGHARAKKLTPEQRSDAARKAVEARWAKAEKLVDQITRDTKALLKKSRAAQARLAKRRRRSNKPALRA
jgi:hypothetical protein